MFGYVVIDKPNILIKDYSSYRGYYCGLCKSIGKNQGQLMRLTVNYDIVLLALLAHNYENIEPVFSEERCVMHPIGKKVPVAHSDEIFKRITEINAILGYYKVVDDVIDEGKHKLIKSFIKGKFQKAKQNHPEFCQVTEQKYNELRQLEKDGCLDELRLASCFGDIMAQVARTVTKKADDNLIELCYNLGKWIYLIDAYDDIKEDYADNKFNPFIIRGKQVDDEFFKNIDKNIRFLLYSTIEKIITCYDKMRITITEGALSNIIYLGLKARTEAVLERRGNKCSKIRL